MTFNVGLKSHSGIELKALKNVTTDIFEHATIHTSTSASKLRDIAGLDLYSGKVDIDTARQIAISNSGLQIQLNNNLASKLQYLNNMAATKALKITSDAFADIPPQVIKDVKEVNPFEAQVPATEKKNNYLFIKAA